MSLTRKIAHHTLLQFGSKILGTVLGLFTVAIMTRSLGQAGYGYYSTVMGFLQFFGILIDFGLNLTTSQMLGQSRSTRGATTWDEETLFGNILSLRIISSLVFFGLAPAIALLFPYPPLVRMGIAIGTASFFFLSLNQIFLAFYQTHLNLTYVALSEMGNRIFLLLAIIAVIHSGGGLLGIITMIVLSNVIQFLLLWIPARRFAPIRLRLNLACWKDIWHRTWPIALSIALNLLYLKTDIIVLSLYRSPEEVGLYGAAYKVVDVLTTFPVLFAGLLLPLLAKFWQTDEKQQFASLVQQGFDAMAVFAWPLIVGTLFVGTDVMALVAGEQFRPSGLILQLLIWASGIIFFNAVFAHAIVALNKQRRTIWAYGIAAIVGVAGYFLTIPTYGALGGAAMTIITEALVAVLVFGSYLRFTGLRPSLRRWPAIGLSCTIMAIALWLTDGQHLALRLVLAIVLYGAAMLATGGISPSFLRDLTTLKKYEA